MNKRTMAEIAKRYDAQRDAVLTAIREGKVSASLSGIEYCPKAWADLDITDDFDRQAISTALTWDGKRHDHEGLRPFTADELALRARVTALMYEPCGPEREARIEEVTSKLRLARPPRP